MHSLPIFVRMAGRPLIVLGDGEAAEAKRRLAARAGAAICGEEGAATLAIVAIEEEATAIAAVARLKARGILVNAVDRPGLCDFTLPAIVDRDPVLVAIATGGVSAGLAKALRQRLEAMLPATLGDVAQALQGARGAIRARWPAPAARRAAIDAALDPGGPLDPFGAADPGAVARWATDAAPPGRADEIAHVALRSADPDDLSLRDARLLGRADRLFHRADVPAAVLARARADAPRICAVPPVAPGPGLSVDVGWAGR